MIDTIGALGNTAATSDTTDCNADVTRLADTRNTCHINVYPNTDSLQYTSTPSAVHLCPVLFLLQKKMPW